jgi:hypothetical protein
VGLWSIHHRADSMARLVPNSSGATLERSTCHPSNHTDRDLLFAGASRTRSRRAIAPYPSFPRKYRGPSEAASMEAMLAHELCHVRRRDNLVAAMHMMVEAVFWFHPLVWWIGVRLMEERERACDEAE